MLRKPDDDIEATIAFKHSARAFATDRDFHQSLNIADADPVTRQDLAVQFDGEHWQTGGLLGFDICGSSHILQDRLDTSRRLDEHVQVITEYLDAHVAADTRYRLIHALLDRLRNRIGVSGDIFGRLLDVRNNGGLRLVGIGPLIPWL